MPESVYSRADINTRLSAVSNQLSQKETKEDAATNYQRLEEHCDEQYGKAKGIIEFVRVNLQNQIDEIKQKCGIPTLTPFDSEEGAK